MQQCTPPSVHSAAQPEACHNALDAVPCTTAAKTISDSIDHSTDGRAALLQLQGQVLCSWLLPLGVSTLQVARGKAHKHRGTRLQMCSTLYLRR